MKKFFVFVFFVSLLGCAMGTYSTKESERIKPEGEVYYTRINIWYENPAGIPSTNYHKGAIIPAGSKVKITKFWFNKIGFTIEDQADVDFEIADINNYSRLPMEELFSRYFSKDDPKAPEGEFSKLTESEKDNVEKGTLAEGMTKEATIIAYGYPPGHKTPNLAGDRWYYWRTRFNTELVIFKDNKIARIERTRGIR
jgi:hypothetical protein